MQLSDVFLGLGAEGFSQLFHSISIGRLKSYQLFDRAKARLHLAKLNSEMLRKSAPRIWARVAEKDEELCTDLAQFVLVCHLEMIKAVLDFLEIPNQNGFFAKDVDISGCLSEGWQQRVWEKFHEQFPRTALMFYINHLAREMTKETQLFLVQPTG
jgi:hypothetical protein